MIASREHGLRRDRFLLIFALATYCVVVLSVAAYRAREDQSSTSDFDDFWKTARHFLVSGRIIEDFGVHNYPPFFVLFMAPFAMLPLRAACVALNLVSLLGLGLTLQSLKSWWRASDENPAWLWLPMLLVLLYATGCLVMGQMTLITLGMLMLALRAMEGRRDVRTGLWLALAISTKVYPALLLLYLFLKGRWRAGLACLTWLIVLNGFLSALVFEWPAALELSQAYWTRSIVGQSALRLASADSDKMSYANQSFAIVARRYTHPTPSGVRRADGSPVFVNLVDWPSTTDEPRAGRIVPVQWLVIAWTIGLAAWGVYRCAKPAAESGPERLRREFAGFCALSLLLSPIAWSFYYCVCLPALVVVCGDLARAWRCGQRFTLSGLVMVVWSGGLAALASPLARMAGYHLGATLLLFVACMRPGGMRRSCPD